MNIVRMAEPPRAVEARPSVTRVGSMDIKQVTQSAKIFALDQYVTKHNPAYKAPSEALPKSITPYPFPPESTYRYKSKLTPKQQESVNKGVDRYMLDVKAKSMSGGDGASKASQASQSSQASAAQMTAKAAKEGAKPCETCSTRTYTDGSSDPAVSFKSGASVAPQAAASAVMSHEREHVSNNAYSAQKEGREVISSTVQLQGGVCPDCGKNYIAGGTTTTVTANKRQSAYTQTRNPQPMAGEMLDIAL